MVRLWESLDRDYKNYLKNLITPDEYETSSVTERIQLRDLFIKELEQIRKEARNETMAEAIVSPSQTCSIKTEVGDTDTLSEDDSSRRNEENQKPAAKAIVVAPSPPCNIKIEEGCDAADNYNEDIDNIVMENSHGGNGENVKIKREEIEDPPPKKRSKISNALKCKEEVEEDDDGPSMNCNVGSEEMQQRGGEQSETDGSAPGIDPNQIKVKRELKECEADKKGKLEKYGGRTLLRRQSPGIGKLGGNQQNTVFGPTKTTWGGELPSDYPIPKMGIKKIATGEDEYDWTVFLYCGYNNLWEISSPKFAGQRTAAVKHVPEIMKRRRIAVPIFVRRCLPGGKLLGWEYVGNYRWVPNEGIDHYESAKNYSKASKTEIAKKYHKSSQAIGDTYGKRRLESWRNRLIDALATGEENETKETNSLATRALELGFAPRMSNEALCHLIVELDEFHRLESIEFVEYDERIYEYCKEGRTTRNAKGNLVEKDGGEPAKASDWYNTF